MRDDQRQTCRRRQPATPAGSAVVAGRGLRQSMIISLVPAHSQTRPRSGLNLILPLTDTGRVSGPAELFGQIIYDLELVDTTLWIAASQGAYRWFFTSGKLQRFQDPHLIIFSQCLAIDRWQEFLWLASSEGLLKLNLKTGQTEPYRALTIDRNYRALAVNDTIAVASSGLGFTMLFHDNPKPYTREFTTDDGLPSSYIFDLKLEGDYLWIGSDRGLTRFLWNNPSRVD